MGGWWLICSQYTEIPPSKLACRKRVGGFKMGFFKKVLQGGENQNLLFRNDKKLVLSRALEEKASLKYFKQNRGECISSRYTADI
jgi:hypothetical protein